MKRQNPSQKPVLTWAMIVRNAEKTVEATLQSLRARTPDAEIVVVDTCSSDNTPEICQRYADKWEEWTGPEGKWNKEMLAFDDAAAARNHAFALATGTFVAWVDSDDRVVGGDEAERLLKTNGYWQVGDAKRNVSGKVEDGKGPQGLEDILRWFDANTKDVVAFHAPYLYMRDQDGKALGRQGWQIRERIVRNDGSWHWVRKAHEILVPRDVTKPGKLAMLNTLLFVHDRDFSPEAQFYSVKRHYDICIKKHDEGTADAYDYIYLENYAQFLCPERRGEFLKLGYEAAHTPTDRCKVLIRAARYAMEQGFYYDALESAVAATALKPEIPDPWICLAEVQEKAENWAASATAWVKVFESAPDHPESETAPSSQQIEARFKAALCMVEQGKSMIPLGLDREAATLLARAVDICNDALLKIPKGPDWAEAISIRNSIENIRGSYQSAGEIRHLFDFLVTNDETEKAAGLKAIIPYNLLAHPVSREIEKLAQKLHDHGDPKKYVEFYNNDVVTGAIASPDAMLTFETAEPRVHFAVAELTKMHAALNRPLDVLEVGSFDGSSAIPIMRQCPFVKYTAIEANEKARHGLIANADRFNVGNQLIHAASGTDGDLPTPSTGNAFDAVIFYEVIEHVPDPVGTIRRLMACLKRGGRLFLSTPWGSFDRGNPSNMERRDARGHVRALNPSELTEMVRRAGGRVLGLGGTLGTAGFGATMHAQCERVEMHRPLNGTRPVAFYVRGALWDWNGTAIHNTGMGASETQITHLGEALAQERGVDVFGPVPERALTPLEEVVHGVGYWRRELLSTVRDEATIISSRAPESAVMLDSETRGKNRKILWLQDTHYPGFDADMAKHWDEIVVVSQWHKDLICATTKIPAEKVTVIWNGIIPEWFHGDKKIERKRNKFVYASSPDRGLIELMRMWPAMRRALPDAELHIFYGWEGCMKLGHVDPAWHARYRKVRTEFMQLRLQPGVVERGRVPGTVLARELRSTAVWAYPTGFHETFGTIASEARAAGAIPVCTPLAGLKESALSDLTRYVEMPSPGGDSWDEYVTRFVDQVKQATEVTEDERKKMSEEACEKHAVARSLPTWRRLIG